MGGGRQLVFRRSGNDNWTVRVIVPSELRRPGGPREMWRSLKTPHERLALRLALGAILAELEAKAPAPEPVRPRPSRDRLH